MFIARITVPGFIVDVEYGRQTPVFWTKNSSFNYLVQENDISTVYEISAKYHTPDSSTPALPALTIRRIRVVSEARQFSSLCRIFFFSMANQN